MGIILKTFFTSVLAIKHPRPAALMWRMASAIVAYETLVGSGEIPPEEPLGYDKWWINLNSPGVFFGTTPKEEI